MDLNLISKQIQFMPDAQLAQSVKNPNGVMPSYLALAELNRRQKLRASAPQQEPQGTVADEVLQSLHSAGMQPQAPMQPGAPMPQQQGIAQAQPQAPGMRGGGLVKGYEDGGLLNGPRPIGNIDYDYQKTPLQSYPDEVRALYGPGQDYSEEMQGIRQLRNDLPKPQSLGQLQGLYTMASKDPMGGLAQASIDAHGAYDKQNADYYNRMMKGYDATFGIKNHIDERAEKIANAIKDVWHVDNTLAESQAKGKELAQYHVEELKEKASKAYQDILTVKPEERSVMLSRAQGVAADQNAPDEARQNANRTISTLLQANKIDDQRKTDEEKQKAAAQMALKMQEGKNQLAAANARSKGDMNLLGNIAAVSGPSGASDLGEVPEGYNKAAMEQLMQSNPGLAREIKAIAEYRRAPVTIGSGSKNAVAIALMNGVQAYSNNTYDATKFGVRNKLINRMEAGDISSSVTNMNTAVGHLEEMIPHIEALNNHYTATEANQAANAIGRRTDKDVGLHLRDVNQDANAVASELKNAYQGKAEAEVQAWREGFNENENKDVQKEAALNAVRLLSKRIEAIRNEYSIGFDGKEYKKPLLSQHSHEVLDKLGIDVDALEQGNFQMKPKGKGSSNPASSPAPDTKGITVTPSSATGSANTANIGSNWKPNGAPDINSVMMLGGKRVKITGYNRKTGNPLVVDAN